MLLDARSWVRFYNVYGIIVTHPCRWSYQAKRSLDISQQSSALSGEITSRKAQAAFDPFSRRLHEL